jgi:nucleoside-diphosphate-sugar epimerase
MTHFCIKDLLETIARLTGFDGRIVWDTTKPNGQPRRKLDVSRAAQQFGFQNQTYREQYGYNSIFLLPVNLYGPRDNFDPETSHVIPALIRKCLEAKERGDDHIVAWGGWVPDT